MTPVAIRAALPGDIPAMHRVRLSVRENALSEASRITEDDYAPYVAAGSAWVGEANGQIFGFAILDSGRHCVWALFVDPAAEGQGIARALHDRMIGWARNAQLGELTLTTAADTRAAAFYRSAGWAETGAAPDGDRCFALRL